jgi:hypothetical protein
MSLTFSYELGSFFRIGLANSSLGLETRRPLPRVIPRADPKMSAPAAGQHHVGAGRNRPVAYQIRPPWFECEWMVRCYMPMPRCAKSGEDSAARGPKSRLPPICSDWGLSLGHSHMRNKPLCTMLKRTYCEQRTNSVHYLPSVDSGGAVGPRCRGVESRP